jgi:hypothetical protein
MEESARACHQPSKLVMRVRFPSPAPVFFDLLFFRFPWCARLVVVAQTRFDRPPHRGWSLRLHERFLADTWQRLLLADAGSET